MTLFGSQPVGTCTQQALTTVANLTNVADAVSKGANSALLIPETNGCRYKDDGVDPTAAIGMPIAAGGALRYDGDLSKIRVVSQTGTCTLNIAYYRVRR